MKVLIFSVLFLVTAACNNNAPTATTYKEQLGAPAAVTDGGGTGGGGSGAGDVEKGKTAFTASCAGCHGPEAMTPLDGSEDIKAGFAASPAAHNPYKTIFDSATDTANITAYLKSVNGGANVVGDPVAGEAIIKAQCEGCHVPGGGGLGPELDQFANMDNQEANASHKGLESNFRDDAKNNIVAALKARK